MAGRGGSCRRPRQGLGIHRLGLAVALLAGACDQKAEGQSSAAPAAAAVASPQASGATGPSAQAESVYAAACAACHGATGKADGAMVAMLNPKPRSFADPAWQQEASDEALRDIILKGGQALGKSPVMPPSPMLAQQPEVLSAMIAKIRGFAPKP